MLEAEPPADRSLPIDMVTTPDFVITDNGRIRGLTPDHLMGFQRILLAYGGVRESHGYNTYESPGLGLGFRLKISIEPFGEDEAIAVRKLDSKYNRADVASAVVRTNRRVFFWDRRLTARQAAEAIKEIDLQEKAYYAIANDPVAQRELRSDLEELRLN